jgi:dTDP-4-dehydrorhamnose reductase
LRVLIVALDAQIRDSLVAQFKSRNRECVSVGLEWIRGREDNSSSPSIPANIGLVVNGLSRECLEQNAEEPVVDDLRLLAMSCKKSSTPLLHLSSCQVFDALPAGLKKEADDVSATSQIGDLLCQLECTVREVCTQYIILRTGPVFSAVGKNLMTQLLLQIEQSEALELSNVGKSCPISSIDLARVISAVTDQLSCGSDAWGTYHYSSSDPSSSYHFAEVVLAVASQYIEVSDRPLELTALEQDDVSWTMPLLDCNVILNTFGIKQLPWRAFIAPTVKKYFTQESS